LGFGKVIGTETLTSTTSEFYEGARSLQTDTPGGANYEGVMSDFSYFGKPTTITASTYVKGSGNVRFAIYGYNSTSGIPITSTWGTSSITLTDSWVRYNQTIAFTDANITRYRWALRTYGGAQAVTYYMDAIQLEASTVETEWQYPSTTNPVNFSSSQNPSTTFYRASNFTVRLNASNEYGYNISPDFYWISASSGETTPVSSFTLDHSFMRIPGLITATDTSTNTPTSWEWYWGDGTANTTGTATPSHRYLKRGRFEIILKATNGGGSDYSDTTVVRIIGYQNY